MRNAVLIIVGYEDDIADPEELTDTWKRIAAQGEGVEYVAAVTLDDDDLIGHESGLLVVTHDALQEQLASDLR